MADDRHAELLHVFLASPGDVGEEREFVRQYLETVLPKSSFLPRPITFDVVSWDHPAASVPMPAHLTPQQAVIRFKRNPADCDIVIVILWGRLGTHLDPSSLVRPDGSRFLSGTEWEYENAFDATPRPDILVYRRTDPPRFNLARGAVRDEALSQFDRIEDFVGRFKKPDGSRTGGFHEYAGLDAFKEKLANDLQHLVAERLKSNVAAAGIGLRAATRSVATIPLPDRCFGRDDDTNAVVAALVAASPHNAILVQGPGGIGKTTLTQQAANHETVDARFGHHRWFAELETATDRDTFDAAILLALGLDPTLGFDAALNRLAQERSLLVLDNLETAWGGDPMAIEQRLARLAAVPDLALLVSFRGDEVIGGAHWSLRHMVQPLSPADTKALFLAIAQKIPGDDPHLLDLLAALGGVPLAICLTARRAARHDSLAELWNEWLAAGTAVAHLPGAAPGRLTSVALSIEFSLRSARLGEAGRRLFRLLGQLPAGIADLDRRALLGSDAFNAREQVQGVGLAFMRAGRLDLLPPVRDHARRTHPPEAADATWFEHYLALTKELGPRAGADGGVEALARLVPELPNIEAAVLVAVAGGGLTPAVEARYGLCETIRFSGEGSSRALASIAVACAAANDAPGEANCIRSLGDIALARSDYDAARSQYEAALPLYHRIGDELGAANCIRNLGDIALARSDHGTARSQYDAALPLYRRVGSVLGEANCIRSLGDIALARSDHDAARLQYEAALPLFQRVGALLGEANCTKSLGDIALARSDYDSARSEYEAALPLYRRLGTVRGEANCIHGLGDIALARSDHVAARSQYEAALPLYRRVGDVRGEANCIMRLGDIALARSDHDAARSQYEAALPLYRRVGGLRGEATCIKSLGDIALRHVDHAAARRQYEAALPLYRRVGDVLGEANCLLGYGDVATAVKDRDAAERHFKAALALYERVRRLHAIALAHERLASVTTGEARAEHIRTAKATWLAMKLPGQAERLDRQFR
jgi:tetratricopeptide (TPR) repeat protein